VQFDDIIVSVMETLGVFGAGLLVALENLFPPIPSEVILPLAGFTASRGTFSVTAVIIATTIGSVAGALVLYWLGRVLGTERLARIADRIPLMHGDDVRTSVHWFEMRRGAVAVFVGRFVPLVRSLISIPAGVARMNVWLFLGLTTLGSGIWNTIFVVLGFILGENWRVVEEVASQYGEVLLVVLIGVGIVLIGLAIRRHRRERQARGEN
jgi:membrane protein DedA with SNARE-associated domain